MEMVNLFAFLLMHPVGQGCAQHAHIDDSALVVEQNADLYTVIAVCVTVFLCVLVFAICLYKIICLCRRGAGADDAVASRKSAPVNTDGENARERQRYDTAWRIVNMCWKEEHSEPGRKKTGEVVESEGRRLSESDEKLYDAARDYLKDILGRATVGGS